MLWPRPQVTLFDLFPIWTYPCGYGCGKACGCADSFRLNFSRIFPTKHSRPKFANVGIKPKQRNPIECYLKVCQGAVQVWPLLLKSMECGWTWWGPETLTKFCPIFYTFRRIVPWLRSARFYLWLCFCATLCRFLAPSFCQEHLLHIYLFPKECTRPSAVRANVRTKKVFSYSVAPSFHVYVQKSCTSINPFRTFSASTGRSRRKS